MKKAFGPDTYKKVKCNAVSVSLCESTLPTLPEADDKLPDSDLISDSLDTLQIWPSYSRKTSIQPYMAVNDIKIGKAAMPSELIRVTYQGQSLLVQMLYDEGSQITLVNQYCAPLVVDTKKTHSPVKISGIIGESFEIRKVLKLQLKPNVQVEGILVPYMAINPTTVKRPLCLKQYDTQWALAIDQHHQGHDIA